MVLLHQGGGSITKKKATGSILNTYHSQLGVNEIDISGQGTIRPHLGPIVQASGEIRAS